MPRLFGLCHSVPRDRPPKPAAGAIPRDPLAKGLRDVAEAESLFAVVEAYAEELSGTLTRLKQIPAPLMDGFEKAVGEGSGDEETWRYFAAQVDKCIARAAGSLSHLETLLLFLPRLRPRFAQVREAAARREESWATKAWHDRQAQGAKAQRTPDRAKSARLNASLEASDDFQRATAELQAAMDQVLTNWSSDTTTALQLLGECYVGIFGAETKPCMGTLGNLDVNDASTDGGEPPDGTDSRAYSSHTTSTKTSLLPPPPPAASEGNALQSHRSAAPPAPSIAHRSIASKAQQAHGGTAAPARSTVRSTASRAQQAHGGAAVPARSTAWRSMGSSAEESDGGAASQEDNAPPPLFVPGEKVEIWSSSQGKWLEGVVMEVYEKGGKHEEYYVPPGVIKVESIAGIKFVQPDQLDNVIRKILSA